MSEEAEIWSEYFRVKNRLMDYDENLREAIANIHMYLQRGYSMSSVGVKDNCSKAQKHISLIFDLAMNCGAFPDTILSEDKERIISVSRGQWRDTSELDWCQEKFRDWYILTKFYNVKINIDNRAAIVRKYGRTQ